MKFIKQEEEYLIAKENENVPNSIIYKGKKYFHLRDGLFICEDASDEGIAEMFGQLVQNYERDYVNTEFNLKVYNELIELAQYHRVLNKISSILDYGCGTGIGIQVLQRHFPSANLFGFDLSHKMIEEASAKGFKAVHLKEEKIEISGEKIDLVIGVFVLSLIKSNFWVQEIYRIMKPNATAVFNIYKPEKNYIKKYKSWFQSAGFEVLYFDNWVFKLPHFKREMPVIIVKK